MNASGLDFEKPILELERKIEELKNLTETEKIDLSSEIKQLMQRLEKLKREIFENLTAWQRVQIARHPQRPYSLDYIGLIMKDFVQLHGDRLFSDDKALVAGLARLNGRKVMIIGHQKGRDTKENLLRNFGCAHPEGYRKALRAMRLAEKFSVPIVIFIDTPGAYPGVGAEERGQAHSIAFNLREMVAVGVPIIVFVIGEGGSGGALGIGIGDRVCILENAYYSVISPEGCAAILWRDRAKAPEAAEALKLTAGDLLKMGIVDEIIKEPLGGAHRDAEACAKNIKAAIEKYLQELLPLPKKELLEKRYKKFRKIGVFKEGKQ
ncbi:MAG: acetyl-CoA carboxylase carboxyltransferase subunit alpha [Candidatus Omnitrophica bacterium]|nr:acetyl-CoA carboxylase carboxyltransferase subunit alpha [Candidatus Omnitrophota bacterium]MBU4140604.1 acetyl-CoA carboxylase carboxyltransferase subunit alpha [Candidatus Omnitrophota bacterium]